MNEPMIHPDTMAPTTSGRNFYAESVYECQRADITDEGTRHKIESRLRFDAYLQMRKPWLDMVTMVYSVRAKPPSMLMNADGTIHAVKYEWTEQEQATLDIAQRGLEQCAAQCGLTLDSEQSAGRRE